MSRTYRNNGKWVNPDEWDKPWHATGDHHPSFFSAHPKKYIKNLSSSVHRAQERIVIHTYKHSEDYEDDILMIPYNKAANPWDIDWFRD